MDLFYGLMGRLHAGVLTLRNRQEGQGTVEYVALILLVAAVLAGVVVATRGTKFGAGGIAQTIVTKLRTALGQVH